MKKHFNSIAICRIGQRETNQDNIFPNPEDDYTEGAIDNLFLVCDGMGGHENGEIASDLICSQMSMFFIENKIENSNKDIILDGVRFVENKFDNYLLNNEGVSGMGSTMTLLHLHHKGATLAHIGDSRIYQIRNGKIVFKTKDHSHVQALFDAGILQSEEEMREHPEKNIILQAVRGASLKATKPDVQIITDLQENDIFFLCTDGVVESFWDSELEEVFSTMPSLEAIGAKIAEKCNKESSDNFSFYLVQLLPEYINSLSIDIVEKLTTITNDEKSSENHKTMTRIFPSSTEEVIKAKENKPDTKTQIIEPSKSANNPILEESELEKTQSSILDNPSILPQEISPNEETKEEDETPIIQAAPASDYQENKPSKNTESPSKSQVLPNKKEVENPIYEKSIEEEKPKIMKYILLGIIGAILAIMVYIFLNKDKNEEETNQEKISQAVTEIKTDKVTETQNLSQNPVQNPTTTADDNSALITQNDTSNNTDVDAEQLKNMISDFENYLKQNKKNEAERLLQQLQSKINKDQYNSLNQKLKNKFSQIDVVKPKIQPNSLTNINENLQKEFLKIAQSIESKIKVNPKRAKDEFKIINKKYHNLKEYSELKDKIE